MKQSSRKDSKEQEIWFSSLVGDDTHTYNAEKAFHSFQSRVRESNRRKKLSLRFIYGAACVALFILSSSAAYWIGEKNAFSDVADIVVESPAGSTTKLTLPDGTLVWLNNESKIVYSQRFGIEDRSLDLEGEAYFEVTHNPELPFAVKTEELSVTVLGTKFNYRNYPEDQEVQVNLIEGKVRLENLLSFEQEILNPNEKVVLNKQSGVMTILKKQTTQDHSWVNHIMQFEDNTLEEIAAVLERYYKVDFVFKNNKAKEIHFHAKFNRQEQSIFEVVEILQRTKKFSYKHQNNTIEIY